MFPNTPRSATTSGVWNRFRKWATIFIRPSGGEIVALSSVQCLLEEPSGTSGLQVQQNNQLCLQPYGISSRCRWAASACPGHRPTGRAEVVFAARPEGWPLSMNQRSNLAVFPTWHSRMRADPASAMRWTGGGYDFYSPFGRGQRGPPWGLVKSRRTKSTPRHRETICAGSIWGRVRGGTQLSVRATGGGLRRGASIGKSPASSAVKGGVQANDVRYTPAGPSERLLSVLAAVRDG